MDLEQHEKYEYARKRIKQKKKLYFHFVLFSLTSVFLFVAYRFFNVGIASSWCIWAITLWTFVFILHFIKVFITDRFMNKNWERDQIDRLVTLQQKKISQLERQIENDANIKNQ